jgi:hypothetical protein
MGQMFIVPGKAVDHANRIDDGAQSISARIGEGAPASLSYEAEGIEGGSRIFRLCVLRHADENRDPFRFHGVSYKRNDSRCQ